MIIIIFHFILFLSIIFLHGLIFSNKVLKLNDNRNFYEISLIGLVITIFISQIVNFLLPLSDNLLYLNIFLLIIFLIFNNKILFSIPKLNIYVFFVAFLLIVMNIYGSGFSDDLDHYHYGFISNADNESFIWGYSYLNLLYGTSPTWLTTQSYLNFNYTRLQDIHVTNGIIFFLLLGLLFSELKSKIKLSFYKPFLFSILMFFLLKYTRLKEFGIDRPASILFCFMIYFYLKYFLTPYKKDFINNFVILSIISAAIISIKIIYLPVFFLPLIILYQYRIQLFKNDKKYLILFIPLTVLLLKNFLASGCIIFPIEKSCISLISWSNNSGAKELSILTETFNKSWTSYKGTLSEAIYINDFNWFKTWFDRGKFEILEFALTICLITILTLISFKIRNNNHKNHKTELKPLFYFTIILFLVSGLIFFLKNPVIRMNHPTLISIMIFFLILFCNFDVKKYNLKLMYSFIFLALLFNSVKNVNRIIEKDFVNNPFMEVSDKITSPTKLVSDDYVYFRGWYGETPIGNRELTSTKFKKKYLFKVIYKID